MYVTYEYYMDNSIGFGGSAISATDFAKYERQARVFLDNVTFNRIKEDATLITDDVKNCLCDIMEKKFKIENDGGIKSSESVGNTTATYVVDSTNTTENQQLYKIAKLYLGNTDLLYRGV